MKNWKNLLGFLFLPLIPSISTSRADVTKIEVFADTKTGQIFPKDFLGVYQTPLQPLDKLLRSLSFLQELGIKNLRYELGWGKPDALAFDCISGSVGKIKCDFSSLDPFFSALRDLKVNPLFVISYCPNPLKSREGWEAWKDPPSSLVSWRYVCKLFAKHLADLGLHPSYEIWNEPDLGNDGWKDFFYGDPSIYSNVYKFAVEGLLEGDGKATVGGAGVAWNQAYNQAILSSGARVDFISIHAYGPESLIRHLDWAISLIRGDIPIYLTEYASFNQFGLQAPVSRYQASSAFFRDLKKMLEYYPVLRKVYWAQWIDDALGLLTNDLHRKALFNAFYIYQRLLPKEACKYDLRDGEVGVLAGSDREKVGVVVWNESEKEKRLRVIVRNLPFKGGRMEVYRIDSQHSSFVDKPESERLEVVELHSIESRTAQWEGTLPPLSTLFLMLSK
jgi:hypothetical protein